MVKKKIIDLNENLPVRYFLREFGPDQLTSFHFILLKLDFYKPTVIKLPFAGLQHMQQ